MQLNEPCLKELNFTVKSFPFLHFDFRGTTIDGFAPTFPIISLIMLWPFATKTFLPPMSHPLSGNALIFKRFVILSRFQSSLFLHSLSLRFIRCRKVSAISLIFNENISLTCKRAATLCQSQLDVME